MSDPKPKESRLVRGLWWALAISIPTVLYGYAGWSMWREAATAKDTNPVALVLGVMALSMLFGWWVGKNEPRR